MIYYDTREKPCAVKPILKTWDKLGIQYERRKLNVGDYMDSSNPHLVIERKGSFAEILANLSGDSARFDREFKRGLSLGVSIKLLIENDSGIKKLEDVYCWKNPNHANSKLFMDGRELMERIHRIKIKYGVDVFFCEKRETPYKILEILGEKEGEKHE